MKHHSECRFLKASKGVPVECEHGYDVCPICDPCNCADSIPYIEMEITSTPVMPVSRSFNITDTMRLHAMMDLAKTGVMLFEGPKLYELILQTNEGNWVTWATGTSDRKVIDNYIIAYMPRAVIPDAASQSTP